MLPDVAHEQRSDDRGRASAGLRRWLLVWRQGERVVGIVGDHDLEVAVAVNQPAPAATEDAHGVLIELQHPGETRENMGKRTNLLLHLLKTLKVQLDHLKHFAGGRAATGDNALEEKAMIPDLRDLYNSEK